MYSSVSLDTFTEGNHLYICFQNMFVTETSLTESLHPLNNNPPLFPPSNLPIPGASMVWTQCLYPLRIHLLRPYPPSPDVMVAGGGAFGRPLGLDEAIKLEPI